MEKSKRGGARPNSGWRNRETTTETRKFTIDIEVLNLLDETIEKGKRSKFITEAIREKMERGKY